jgi:hypothetical protein
MAIQPTAVQPIQPTAVQPIQPFVVPVIPGVTKQAKAANMALANIDPAVLAKLSPEKLNSLISGLQASAKRTDSRTAEQRSQAAYKASQTKTAEQRHDAAVKAHVTMTINLANKLSAELLKELSADQPIEKIA